MTRRKILNCFDRLELLVGNRVPAHGSEAPFLVNLREAILEEKRIAEELLGRDLGPEDVEIKIVTRKPTAEQIGRIRDVIKGEPPDEAG